MYENGRRVNGKPRKRIHKRKMQEKHARKWGQPQGWKQMKVQYAHWTDSAHDPLRYWKDYSLSGPRQYAKDCTNSKLRAVIRDEVARALKDAEFMETCESMRGAQYRKRYDYDWTIW